ncbi:integrase core domain-containing protein [Streptomyces spiralis]|uniref:integrase core domain-containing protein n=1 Tax=Streptomyces spiralis TaxID=66376 RepID=UPI001E49B7A0|nr:integrase core domain-containing protein [Streptomyces spiralis]
MCCGRRGSCRACRIDDVNLFNSKLQEWEDYYNYHRPHGALAGQTPANAYDRKLKTH